MKNELYSLTNPQKSILLTEEFYKGTNINNICGTAIIDNVLDFDLLKKAMHIFINNHDSFHFKLALDNNELKQYLDDTPNDIDIEIVDIDSKDDISKIENSMLNHVFDIYNGDLFCMKIFRLKNNTGGFIVNIHHLFGDSWSLGIVANDIVRIYSCLLNGEDTCKNEDFSYLSYINSEKEYLTSDKFKKDKEYWENIFNTVPELATIPGSIAEIKDDFSPKANRKLYNIDNNLMDKINAYCKLNHISVFNFFMAVYAIYIGRVSRIDDFVLGTPILNRTNFNEKNTTGMFINTAPLRFLIDDSLDFKSFVSNIAKDSLGMLRHQKYYYQNILEDLRNKDASIPNLYNVLISYQVTKANTTEGINYNTRWNFNGTTADDMDIHLFDLNDTGSINVAYDYKISKYTDSDIENTHNRIMHMIWQILEKDDICLKDIEIVTNKEKYDILYKFNATEMEYPRDKTIVDLFEEQVEKTPNNIAVVFEDKKLTYRELNEKANQLARFLLDKGISTNSIVGIMFPRSLEIIISFLGVLKAGACYIPIDPDYPADRISYMLEDSNSKLLLSFSNISKLLSCDSNIIFNLDSSYTELLKYSTENINRPINSEDLSYIIYTSGSTGKPKGVKLKHLSLSNLTHYCNDYVEYLKNNIYRAIVSVTTASFDIFIFETLISLQRGLKLVIANEKEQNIPICLDELIARENIEIIQTTPSRMQIFYSNINNMPHFNNLKFITLAGEQLPISLVKNLKSVTDCLIYNGYGPSETTVFATLTDVTNKEKISIGKPLPNTQIYIMDQNYQLCPIGVPGEICISGAGVGYGYINKDELTKNAFVTNPFIPNSVMYKTGDLGLYDRNGEIYCLGRLDNQVKVRGLRIELEEIEKALLNIPNITNCTVKKSIDDNGHEFLCAYFIKSGSIDIPNIKSVLYKTLPNYMVPQYFMELQELPYTPNGKIDKKRLPKPKIEVNKKTIAARNNLDTALIDIFKSLFKLNTVGIEDSLYDLGGDSLTAINLATAIYNKLGIAISIKDIFQYPTIKELADYISTLSKTQNSNIKPAKKMDYYPTSSAQKRIYYASSVDSGSTLYNIAGGIIVDKALDTKLLQECFQVLIDRHEVLRTHFEIKDNDIVQIIEDKIDFTLLTDILASNDLNSVYADFVKPFDLAKAPLFRAKAVSLANNKMLLLLDMHHIISDGTSLGILLQELCDLYNGNVLPEKHIDYKDFTLWEKEQFEKDEFKNLQDFWVNQFNDEIPLLNMPTTYPRPSVQSFEGSNYYANLPKDTFEKINKVAKNLGITPYMLMLSAYYILLSKYSSSDDILVGTPIIGRELPELSNMLGMFVNTLVLRNKVNHSASFNEFASSIKEHCLACFQNQAYPFDKLVKELNIKRDTSRNPLFDVMFIYQNNGYPAIDFKDAHTEYFIPDSKISKFDLSLEVIPTDNEFLLRFEYCTKLFDEDFIKRLSSHYINILNAILENNEIKIADIDMLSLEERNQILYDFNNTKIDYPKDKTIVDLFEEQVEKTPDNIAVVFEDKKLTYRELNEKANQLANKLYSIGIKSGDVIGVSLTRSIELLVSICAIFKVGAVYMPMYTGYPKERLTYMLKNSNAKLLITSSKNKLHNLDNIEKEIIDSIDNINYQSQMNLMKDFSYDSIAYIIYTSGSTGKPKGVQISNRNLINFVYAFKKYFGNIGANDIFLSSTNISFDVSIFELFLPILSGAQLVLYKEEVIKNIALYCDTIVNKKIKALYIPPNILNEVYELLRNKTIYINKMLVGVEAIRKSTLNKYLKMIPNLKIINGYGPTETTICCTAFDYSLDETNDSIVSIGRPLYNNQIFILSKDKNLQPIGVTGEIYVAGDGVGCGYINDNDKTKLSYVLNNFNSSSVYMYKTGDLAKWNEDGTISFIGRNDSQIKISGHRIELEEINSVINCYPKITKAFSTTYNLGNTTGIVSYFTADKDIPIKDLTAFLQSQLTDYMVPNFIMQINKFPLTPNGKIDKDKLPKNFSVSSKEYVAPRNEFENSIAEIWKNLFFINRVGINDNFFDLGGDSLIAIKLSIKVLELFNVSINVNDIFQYPTIKELADYISTLSKTQNSNIKPAKKMDFYPTSSAQKRIYYASSVDSGSTLYNIAGGIIVDKALDIKLLQECFQVLIDRHEVLRTHFEIKDNDIVQIIEDKIDFTLLTDILASNDLNSVYADFVKPFDLAKAPLFRAKAVSLPNNKMLLLLDMHHIISDGTSLGILLQELCDLYNGNVLPEKHIDYKDFTLWEKEQFEKDEFKNLQDFWVNQFNDEIPLLNMPTTYPRPSVQSFEGSNYYANLPKDTFEKINKVAKNLGITPYMLMLSAYYILLSKYSSSDDILVGTPIIGRELPELSNMLGMFVNTLVLRNKVNHSASFNEFASSIKEHCLDCFQNQAYPFDKLVKELNIKRDTSRNPLFDVMFIYQNNGYPAIDFKDAHTEYFIPDSKISKFDLSLEVIPTDNEFLLRFEYCTKLFDEDFIKRLSSHYINILNAVLENNEIKIADIDMLSLEERNQILYDFNNTKMEYPKDKTIAQLFEEQVEKTPDNIAVVFENEKLTYRELNEKANQLARFLLANSVTTNDIVCLLLDKSLESIISIIATLKVGAAYLPIDVNYPSDRIDYIIRDSKSKILLTTKDNIHKSNGTIQALCIDIDSPIYSQNDFENIYCKNISADNLAYIMYTSGSTGNPKGVMVKHRNIIRLVKNNKFITFNEKERILQTGSIVFDACTFEIFGALLNGFELYIIKKEELLDSQLLQDYLINNKITILWLTAPLFNQLCEENPHMFRSVKTLLTGGDVLSPKHINMVKAANPNLTVINGYGPTENTTFSCCFTIDKKYTNSIPIGKPISNSTAYVVSSTGNLNPIGVPGELWVGGDGVAKGYLNNDNLTNEKFIKNPFGTGLVYKTGDLVKWLPNGCIDFIGRIDNQVKIRGFRVEIGEVNSKIATFPSMKECFTIVNEIKGEKNICSYIVADKQIDIQELKQYLKRILPIYMIPTYFMQLEKLPINTNGKVDRKSLPTNFKSNHIKDKIKQPTNENERILLDIFKKLLSFDDIGIDDDFFELGGNSLLAIKLQVEAISNNLQITYADIFDHPTVQELAKCINHTTDSYTENDFDYEKYNAILENNRITTDMKIQNTPIGNVLLTGFTGFLGAHVLDSYLKKETGTIYCLIRGKNNMSPEDRLKNVLHFYFDTKYDNYIGNRIKLVEGDITLNDFGLNMIDYNVLGTDVNTVIHCAALVKHYGSYNDFERINIIGTKRVVDFCKMYNLKLLHISTISVSGNNLAEGSNIDNNFENDMLFNETNFYIGQNLKNFYVRSKFEAEKLVLDAILDGLQACILRMGNLTSRFSEGKFQQNHFENAFVNRIKSFIQIGCVPDYLLNTYCEFTPIDYCGNAIIDIANHMSNDYTVFHLLNEKHVYLDKLFKMLNEIGITVNLVSSTEFKNIITTFLKDEKKKNDLEGIINNLDNNKEFIYKADVTIDSTFTKEFLSKIGFEWPCIDTNYIRNYFKYLTDIGYFNLNIL